MLSVINSVYSIFSHIAYSILHISHIQINPHYYKCEVTSYYLYFIIFICKRSMLILHTPAIPLIFLYIICLHYSHEDILQLISLTLYLLHGFRHIPMSKQTLTIHLKQFKIKTCNRSCLTVQQK